MTELAEAQKRIAYLENVLGDICTAAMEMYNQNEGTWTVRRWMEDIIFKANDGLKKEPR